MLEGPTAALFLLAACLACWAGMGWLALAMDGHWEQVFQAEQPQRVVWRLRAQGAAGLALGLVLCLQADHASMAALVWVMMLAAAALSVAMTLSWRPGWLAWLAWGARRA
ncbi:DUF3325 domain-containing protein [Comamonas terrigena]|uniref:DUF3325 domain-containing protein n=1 Tax=Comamonas terrigena TaxID=32013 RepID=UPI00244A4938|nr:DUF3325 domain-containing protein [Comamonas terrigena]MDH1293537.1 DUF3325 domain-containing protein [Comamonas terrigena]